MKSIKELGESLKGTPVVTNPKEKRTLVIGSLLIFIFVIAVTLWPQFHIEEEAEVVKPRIGTMAEANLKDLPEPDITEEPESIVEEAVEPGPLAEPQPVSEEQVAYYEEPATYAEPQAYTGSGYSGSGSDFQRDGRVSAYGYDYTYYSSNVLYHYRTPEWTPNAEGFYTTSDGYLVVASSDHAQGDIVDTPWGQGVVLDTGCPSGVIDMYTNF